MAYHFPKGWRTRALVSFAVAAAFSISAVWTPLRWTPWPAAISGFAWIIGALIGGGLHLLVTRGQVVITSDVDR